MATWTLADIRDAYLEGETRGATHLIVAYDSFSGDNYPIYVMPGEDPRKKRPTNGDKVDECYRYALGWDSQSKEHRALHWERPLVHAVTLGFPPRVLCTGAARTTGDDTVSVIDEQVTCPKCFPDLAKEARP